MLKRFLGFLIVFLFCIQKPVIATTWLELSEKLSSDNNVYSYVIPYYDNYSLLDFRANHKDKLTSSTHYALNYNLQSSLYSELIARNYYNNILGGSLEEDLSDSLVALINIQANVFDYSDSISSKYDYLMLTTAAALRFYIFAFEFTSVDWGLEYNLYNLPNYNFELEGWTPSLNFLEEVAEYHGFGTYLTVKQALPWTLDLEATGKIMNQFCPERPLFASATRNDFTSTYRSDLESTLLVKLTKRYEKSSYISLSVCSTYLQSNANAQVYNPDAYNGAGGTVLLEDYYQRAKTNLILDGMYVFGQEMSYFRLYSTLRKAEYGKRNAQEADGSFKPDTRSDTEYSVLVEFDQRLGYLWQINWLLKLGYQYTQNLTNDYYYNYKREVIYLGLSSFLYL